MHSQITISNLSLTVNNKELFSNFSCNIFYGQKIAIIGDNGCGKSVLLKMLSQFEHFPDEIVCGNDLIVGYVPQTISHYQLCSGGERFNKLLSQELAKYPNILLLDEPTNHLDEFNRNSLFHLLKHNPVTQIVISHDPELLNLMDIIWHIHDGKVTVYNGNYEDYLIAIEINRKKLNSSISELRLAKSKQHESLMKEQSRAKKSREQGCRKIDQRKWPTVTSKIKAGRSNTTSSNNLKKLNIMQNEIENQLEEVWVPEEVSYSFNLKANSFNRAVLTIHNGECGYVNSEFKLTNLNINLFGNERLALVGNNGSGKSTFVKAILNNSAIWKSGEWILPSKEKVAYLDQHYSELPSHQTVLEFILSQCDLNGFELRSHLNKFLFRKEREVYNKIENLSGGEKARLSLASIALKEYDLLILDEVTNNIDLTTRNHIVALLKSYSGAMIVISHDKFFLSEIGLSDYYQL